MDDEKKIFLLFSADVINSTAMKSRLASQSNGWLPIFNRFYKAFPKLLMSKSKSFKIWKYVGDELLFYVEIKELTQIPPFVNYFKESLLYWNSIPSQKTKDDDGNEINTENHPFLKGCIWIAQTPKIDKDLWMEYEPGNSNKKQLLDFVGPSIDCGFRIAKFASQNHIILSVEVLQECIKDKGFQNCLYYLNSEFLKGVFNEEFNYPIFFLILDKQKESIDLILRNSISQINADSFLDDFYNQFTNPKYSKIVGKLSFLYFQHNQKIWNLYASNKFIKQNEDIPETQKEEIEEHITEMKEWFLENYIDPAESCPFESREGGYFYMNGGPYNAADELNEKFSYPEEEIQEAAEQLENEYSVYDWDKRFSPYDND